MTILDDINHSLKLRMIPILRFQRKKDGMFFIFRSIEAWKEEKCKDEDIPVKNLF